MTSNDNKAEQIRVAVLVGSLRKESFTRKVAHAIGRLASSQMQFDFIEIGDLPSYNPDLEGNVPEQWARFREQIRSVDAVLFATPEYNRSVPGFLKNAIDVGSRPMPESVWRGKPAAVVSVSPGMLGAFGANHHLRQMLVFLDMPPLQQPEIYLSQVAGLLDEQGNFAKEDTRKLIEKFVGSFEAWVRRNRSQTNKQ